ncbi:hypothetical protein CL618_02115 [archaeon]|nr:hypothetical protein [archaeon]
MISQRIKKFASILVNHSTNIQPNEKVIISADSNAEPLILEIYKQIIQKGAYPTTKIILPQMNYTYYNYSSTEQLKRFPEISFQEIKQTQAFISIPSPQNTRELSSIDPHKISLRSQTTNPITDYIVNSKNIRRVSTTFPSFSLAQDSEMSLEEYNNFFFKAVIQDWEKETKKYNKWKSYFKNADQIRILSSNTDLKFSMKKRPMILDEGKENMPGGEMFCAPLHKTTKGYINFTYPAIRAGTEVTDIFLEFKDGKVIKSNATKNKEFLKKMIQTDAGSPYLGELGIGLNKNITKFTKNLLFDEKQDKTIHLALGMAYKECLGTNKSALHWDIVKDMKDSELIVDGTIIQKNGKWR